VATPVARTRRRKGSIAIYVAIAAIVLIGVMGLAVDTGYAVTARMQLQAAADAAALAGAAQLGVPGQTNWNVVRAAAVATASRNNAIGCCPNGVVLDPNPSNAPEGDVVVGKWKYDNASGTYVLDPSDPAPDAVQVFARCGGTSKNPPLQLLFGPLFGQSTSEGGRPAIARLSSASDPFVLILDGSANGALSMNGSGTLDVSAGSIQVNSSDSCGLKIAGNSGTITAQSTKIVGSSCAGNGLVGSVASGAPAISDPLASLPEPSSAGMSSLPAITGSGTYSPGYYPGGISMNGGTAVLLPGVYVIGSQNPGKGVDLHGSAFLSGDGVTLFLESGASLGISGNGAGFRLTPPLTGTYAGITIFESRSDTQDASLGGGGSIDLQGILYVPSATITLAGSADRKFGRLIADQVSVSGGATYTITGSGPRVFGSKRVFLAD
jgi:Flp pilus assembly protein TadG